MFDKPITTPLQALSKLKEKITNSHEVAVQCWDTNKRMSQTEPTIYYKGQVEAYRRCLEMIEEVEARIIDQDTWW